MLIELANFCFFIVIALSLSQVLFSGFMLYNNYEKTINFNSLIVTFLTIDFIALLYSFYISDFSVLVVAQNSSSLKPILYKLASLWASYQGSLFLWLFFIAIYACYFAKYKLVSIKEKNCAMLIIAILMSCMAIFIAFFASPFARLYPAILQGQDLSPLLEDLNLAIHPPLLYLGYAALAISFCHAIAALLLGRLDKAFTTSLCLYNRMGWIFLSLSIITGSYWAYYELGWGGYWSFDPVENSALLPWLASLGVLHFNSKMKLQAIFLSLLAFTMAIIGSFFARTNFVFSLHSFMVNFAQSVSIAIFIISVILPAWFIFLKHRSYFKVENCKDKKLLYVFYILLFSIIFSLFLAQMLPLLYNIISTHSIYINIRYYYYSFVPLCIVIIFLMIYASVRFVLNKKQNLYNLVVMLCSHIGILIMLVAICFSSLFSTSKQVALEPRQNIYINNIKLTYLNSSIINANNYYGTQYNFLATKNGKTKKITVQKRNYLIQQQQTIIVGLANFGLTQLYIVMQQQQQNKVMFRIDYNYSILAIWLGAFLCIIGAVIGLPIKISRKFLIKYRLCVFFKYYYKKKCRRLNAKN